MTEPMSEEQIAARIARFDQQHAGAVDLARVVAAQYTIYRHVGIPADSAAAFAELYLEAVLGNPTVDDTEDD